MHSVTIIQEHLPEFRIPFYERLREILKEHEISLCLVFAPNQRNTFLKSDLEWAKPVPITWFGPLAWQPVMRLCKSESLVIIQQETKYLANPMLQAWSKIGGPRVAYWGHGRNFQKEADTGIRGSIKRFLANQVSWWFAYNDLCAKVVSSYGFPDERITSVGNAVDTKAMKTRLSELDAVEIHELRSSHGIRSQNIAVYTGGLYPKKRIGFLLEAAEKIRQKIPDFELIIIGDGPLSPMVKDATEPKSWIHYVGSKNDEDKVPFWSMAKLLLMPGLVGLVVVDSFALGVPIVTTDYPFHSPEIDYLKNGENGCLVACGDDPQIYADYVVELFQNPDRIEVLKQGAIKSSELYSTETMAKNFANGVMECLNS